MPKYDDVARLRIALVAQIISDEVSMVKACQVELRDFLETEEEYTEAVRSRDDLLVTMRQLGETGSSGERLRQILKPKLEAAEAEVKEKEEAKGKEGGTLLDEGGLTAWHFMHRVEAKVLLTRIVSHSQRAEGAVEPLGLEWDELAHAYADILGVVSAQDVDNTSPRSPTAKQMGTFPVKESLKGLITAQVALAPATGVSGRDFMEPLRNRFDVLLRGKEEHR